MKIYHKEISFDTEGELDIKNLTPEILNTARESKVVNGIINVFSIGSTAAISILEYEPGLKKDMATIMDKMVPKGIEYEHHKRWGDFNGHSHIRASIVKSSITLPLINGDVVLGTWQQVVFIEFDIRPRKRKVIVSILGEE